MGVLCCSKILIVSNVISCKTQSCTRGTNNGHSKLFSRAWAAVSWVFVDQ